MAGGLMQLVAVGAQDAYLTASPTVTFFQTVYKRASAFALETMEQVLNGSQSNGGRVSVTIARNGDLIGPMYLELTVQSDGVEITGDDGMFIAEKAISSVELTIGGQRIDRHYARWFALYSELHMARDKKDNYFKLTSGENGSQVFLPLQFFFNRTPGLYLPLVALQYHEVRLDIDLASDFETNFVKNMKVWGTYVFLGTEERKRIASREQHEMLIEQVQHTGTESLDTSTKQIRLSYNHPVKELVWCNAASSSAPHDFMNGLGNSADGPVSSMKLLLNGQDRQKVQSGKFYNQMTPYLHYEGSPSSGVYAYPFALRPGDAAQPNGSANFSRIDNAQVEITPAAVGTLHMFAVNWNVLRIASGLGGMAFSN